MHFSSAAEIRAEIAQANPNYDGIQHLKERGDVFQWGGAWLCEDGKFPTEDGRANLLPIEIPNLNKPQGHFYVTTRRGKQFNSMIYSNKDPFNNADRYDVLINAEDARELRIVEGENIVVYNKFGTFQGHAKFEATRRGNVQVHWPEGNVLIPKGVYETYAGIPEYNTAVKIEKADTFNANKDLKYKEKPIEDLEVNVG
jgi:anaerobic selenocysteine-containing dehydrogenase